ncbi:MAG: H-X9-DG-CTERM domain-containing protein [Armatimonadota bacterium]
MSTQYYACGPHHNDGANVSFVDGHIKWLKLNRGPIGGGYPYPPYGWPSGADSYFYSTPLWTFWDPFGSSTPPA